MSFDRTILLKELIPVSYSFTGYEAENIENTGKNELFGNYTIDIKGHNASVWYHGNSISIYFPENYKNGRFLPPDFNSFAINIDQLAYELNKSLKEGSAYVSFLVFSKYKREKEFELFTITFDYVEAKKAFFYYFGLIYNDDETFKIASLEKEDIPFMFDYEEDFSFDRFSLLRELVPIKYYFSGYSEYDTNFQDYKKNPLFHTHKIVVRAHNIHFFL
ncbi:MAG: hypothetical protein IJ809_04650 [Clostridia bacterium]|nr:hypothetical protein [Clostridia bacterium]